MTFTCIHIIDVGIASVQFHIIHIPFGECLRINFHMANNAWIASASVRSIVLINAEFQSLSMNLVRLRNVSKIHSHEIHIHSSKMPYIIR